MSIVSHKFTSRHIWTALGQREYGYYLHNCCYIEHNQVGKRLLCYLDERVLENNHDTHAKENS